MNKGRNILLLMIFLLSVSVLTFFTVFERGNTNGVVDGVRYVVVSEQDGVKTLEFYFPDPDRVETGAAIDDGEKVKISIDQYGYEYVLDKKTYEVTASETGRETDEGPFDTYSKNLFKTMIKGKDRFMNVWQAIIVGVLCLAGSLIILFAEEIWHIIKKKGQDEIPQWKDMNGIKWAGRGVIALGIGLLILFILL